MLKKRNFSKPLKVANFDFKCWKNYYQSQENMQTKGLSESIDLKRHCAMTGIYNV